MKFASYLGLLTLILVINTFAAEPQVWTVSSRADVLRGDARGVSIDQDGAITVAPSFTESFKTEQPYIWSSVADAAGIVYLGTGGDGKIFKADGTGGKLFADLAEQNVSALALAPGGGIFAATMPDGKVYRIDAGGTASVYFEPKAKYIWSIAVLPDGSLAVATGDDGKLYKVRAANASPEASLLYDSGESHIISLAVDKQGDLYAGTDPGGLVLRFSADGKAFGLLDASLREIHDLAIGDDGSVYALAVSDAAASIKSADAADKTAAAESKPMTVEKPSLAQESAVKSRFDLSSARSAVYRILPDGGSDLIWASSTVTGFSLVTQSGGVWIGTSDKGRVYSVTNDGRETLLAQTGAGQLSTMLRTASGIIATSSNQGVLYRAAATSTEGTYDSPVLDARTPATWGRIWWRSTGNVSIQTRVGNTERPDRTWSDWSAATTDQKGSQIVGPKARYIQWRAVLKGSASATVLNEVSLSFIGRNIAPEILSLNVLPTNIGLAPNPANPIDPNIELSGIDPALFGVPSSAVAPRRLYQRAATALQWTAEDRNGDKMVYDVYYKRSADLSWKLLKSEMNETFLTIDGQTLADGRYLFKVVVHDSPSNPASMALAGEKVSDPVEIDNTPPTVTAVGAPQTMGDKTRFIFEAADAASYISRAEYSINAGEWMPVYADDGISDGPRERYTIDISTSRPGEYAVTFRAYDVSGNSANIRAAVTK